jgi:hypothetical protein
MPGGALAVDEELVGPPVDLVVLELADVMGPSGLSRRRHR